MSVDQLHLVAYAAGYGAVFEDDIDIQRGAPPDNAIADARTGAESHFVPGWHMPDAPAPRRALAAPMSGASQGTALAVVGQDAPATSWLSQLQTATRSMATLIGTRGVPA